MENITFITRQNKTGKSINSQENQLDILELLKNEYDYINNDIIREKYEIKVSSCDVFKELLYKDKVVGFVTYNVLNKFNYLLTNVYIIRGYRRNHIFFNELKKQYSSDKVISIYEPTRQIIEILLKLGYARNITKNIVISSINFKINNSTALSQNQNNNNSNKLINSNIYDLNICASLSVRILNRNSYEIKYTPVKNDDEIHYDCIGKRKKLGKEYFDNIIQTLINKDLEIERWLFLLQHNLPSRKIKTEEIIGTTDSLSETLTENIESGNISEKEAKQIQNQLFLELKTFKVTEEALQLRLDYLIEYIHEKRKKSKHTDNYCPYCKEPISNLENYCLNCGYTLYDIDAVDEDEFVYKNVLEEKQSYKYSFSGIKEKKTYSDEEYLIKISMCLIIDNMFNFSFQPDFFNIITKKHNIEHIDLKKLMVDEGYIHFSMDEENWDAESQFFNKTELKAILKKHNCKVSGNKYELKQRIKREVPLGEIESQFPKITMKGRTFRENNNVLVFHRTFLNDYVYSEFKDFCDENNDKEFKGDLIFEFLNEHILEAENTRNHDQLVDSLRIQAQFYSKNEKYNQFLENELRVFLININMIYLDEGYYPYYKPIDSVTWELFNLFPDMFPDDLFKETFDEVYKSFDKGLLNISYRDTLYYMEQIFKNYNIYKVNKDIKHKYYKIRRIKSIKNKKDKCKIRTLDSFF